MNTEERFGWVGCVDLRVNSQKFLRFRYRKSTVSYYSYVQSAQRRFRAIYNHMICFSVWLFFYYYLLAAVKLNLVKGGQDRVATGASMEESQDLKALVSQKEQRKRKTI